MARPSIKAPLQNIWAHPKVDWWAFGLNWGILNLKWQDTELEQLHMYGECGLFFFSFFKTYFHSLIYQKHFVRFRMEMNLTGPNFVMSTSVLGIGYRSCTIRWYINLEIVGFGIMLLQKWKMNEREEYILFFYHLFFLPSMISILSIGYSFYHLW